MADFIAREALMEFPIRQNHYDLEHGNEHFIFGIETVMEYAENLPAADVVPVVHGRWERAIPSKSAAKWSITMSCSVCHRKGYKEYNYCPACGAKMDGGG